MTSTTRQALENALRNGIPRTPTVAIYLQRDPYQRLRHEELLGVISLALIKAVNPMASVFEKDGHSSIRVSDARSWALELLFVWLYRCCDGQKLLPIQPYLPAYGKERAYKRWMEMIRAANAINLPAELLRDPVVKMMTRMEADEANYREIIDVLCNDHHFDVNGANEQRFARCVARKIHKNEIRDQISLDGLLRAEANSSFKKCVEAELSKF